MLEGWLPPLLPLHFFNLCIWSKTLTPLVHRYSKGKLRATLATFFAGLMSPCLLSADDRPPHSPNELLEMRAKWLQAISDSLEGTNAKYEAALELLQVKFASAGKKEEASMIAREIEFLRTIRGRQAKLMEEAHRATLFSSVN